MIGATSTPLCSALLIDGQLVAGEGFVEPIINPATGEVIAEVPASTAKDVDRAVAAAKKALPDWLDTERLPCLATA